MPSKALLRVPAAAGAVTGMVDVEVEHRDGSRRILQADRAVVLATGSRVPFPPVEGLATVGAWDNRDITTTDRAARPRRRHRRHRAVPQGRGHRRRGAARHRHHRPAQIIVDTPRRTIVGATFTGAGAAELVHAATIAIAGRVTLGALWHAVPAFPTLTEVWLRLLEAERDS